MPEKEPPVLKKARPPNDLPCMFDPSYLCACDHDDYNNDSLWSQAKKLNKNRDYRSFFNRNGFFLNTMTLRCLLIAPQSLHYSPATNTFLKFPSQIIDTFGQPLRQTRKDFILRHDSPEKPMCPVYQVYLDSQAKDSKK